MNQPFRSDAESIHIQYPIASVHYRQDHIILETKTNYTCLSNAVWNGGLMQADKFVNWKVPLDFAGREPAADLKHQLQCWGYAPEKTVGLQTAAKLTQASIDFVEGDAFRALICVTVGTGNAVRAGQPRATFAAYELGTVNCIVLLDGAMSESAIANLLITITEAKTAALQDAEITDVANGMLATGTTTDAIVIGVSQTDEYRKVHRYAGTATSIGHCIERMVYQAVIQSTITQAE